MNCIDLTLTDEDDILYVKKKYNDSSETYVPNIQHSNNAVFNFFYGTEDMSQKYLSVQHPLNRKVLKTQYSVRCPICHETFYNCNFLNHIVDHYKCEYSPIDQLLMPQINNLLYTFFNDASVRKIDDLKCEICCLGFDGPIGLGQHLELKHVHQDMPYVCFICNFFRTSFLSQLKQHFYDCHKSTEYVICPFCIQSFELVPLSDSSSILDATSFVVHIEKHLLKKQFSCDKCVLRFNTKLSLIFHKTAYHEGKEVTNNSCDHTDMSGSNNKIVKKSLNVTNQPIDVSKLSINSYKLSMACAECRENLANLSQHYQIFNMCTQCGFRSYCAVSFRKHTKTFHSQSECSNYKSIDIYQRGVLICECGYQSMHGDGMASHLYHCQQKTCFTRPRVDNITTQSFVKSDDRTNEYFASIHLQKLEKPSGKQ